MPVCLRVEIPVSQFQSGEEVEFERSEYYYIAFSHFK